MATGRWTNPFTIALSAQPCRASERDVVVGQRFRRIGARCGSMADHRVLAAARHACAPAATSAAEKGYAVRANVDHRFGVRLRLAVTLLTPNLLSVSRVPVPVRQEGIATSATRCLPGLQPAFDVYLPALGQILGQRFRLFAPQIDGVPLGSFLPLAGLIGPDFRRGHAEFCDGGAARRVALLGVASPVRAASDVRGPAPREWLPGCSEISSRALPTWRVRRSRP